MGRVTSLLRTNLKVTQVILHLIPITSCLMFDNQSGASLMEVGGVRTSFRRFSSQIFFFRNHISISYHTSASTTPFLFPFYFRLL